MGQGAGRTDWADPAEAPVRPATTGIAVRARAGSRPFTVDCAFGSGPDRLRLAALRRDGVPLSLPRLFALERFWLGAHVADDRDPFERTERERAPSLPAGAGYPVQQVLNALPSSAVYALLATAYALIYGLIGRINLAFGAFAAVGGVSALGAALALLPFGAGPALAGALLAGTLVPATYGVAAARLVFAPLRGASGQPVLIATVGLALVLGEGLRIAGGNDPRWLGPLLATPVTLARDGDFAVTLTPLGALVTALATAAGGGLLILMRGSAFGRNWRACRDDPGAAALFGVARERVLAQSLALGGACAGLAGGITVACYGDISFAYAQALGLKALAAAVLGGIGSVPGAFLGGAALGLAEAGWSAAFPIVNRDLMVYVALAAALVWRPGGLLGERELVPRRV